MSISTPKGCTEPAVARGELQADSASKLKRLPAFFALGVAGAEVMSAEIGRPLESGSPRKDRFKWRPMDLRPFRHIYVANVSIPKRWVARNGATIYFRLRVSAASQAGYGACYLTSPSLVEYPGADPRWNAAQSLLDIFLQNRGKWSQLEYAPLNDAILSMAVHGKLPDRSAIDAGALVRGDSLLLTCSGEIPDEPHRLEEDAFHYERVLVGESSCASVQTFRASDAADSLNLRLFFAGVLLSAAVGMLLEAGVTGTTKRTSHG
ncbi:MAG: hypothetical protein ACTHLH_03250 [Solirubrobacterales bacterium]